MRTLASLTFGALIACGGAPRPATTATTTATAPRTPAHAPAALARYRALLDGTTPLPRDAEAGVLLRELEPLLADLDPDVRDGVGYALAARLLLDEHGAVPDGDVDELRDRLVARTTATPTPGDEVYGRSFAALVLSVVTAREVAHPRWDDAALARQLDAATGYAARERDLRGYTGAHGWAHAAAHTADWLKFLARHPRLTAAQGRQLLDGVAALVTRAHGHRLAWGEDERLAAAARAVLRRGLLDDAAVDAWLATLAPPLAAPWPEPPAPETFPTFFATQRNTRDLLVSLLVALSVDDAAPAAAALARLRAFMMA